MYQQLRLFINLSLLTFVMMIPLSMTAHSQTLVIPVGSQSSTIALPQRGESKKQVYRQYGHPQKKTAAVGKPPISTWHYANFSVYFEGSTVIHAVVHHKPQHR